MLYIEYKALVSCFYILYGTGQGNMLFTFTFSKWKRKQVNDICKQAGCIRNGTFFGTGWNNCVQNKYIILDSGRIEDSDELECELEEN